MSRGKKPVVAKGTKSAVEGHFAQSFPIHEVWQPHANFVAEFGNWHMLQVAGLAAAIEPKILSGNEPQAVAAKFLNTFLHQLTKYAEARHLVPLLHLPLDSRVFVKLKVIKSSALASLKASFANSPYGLPYADHLRIQDSLLQFLKELNARRGATFKFTSRIELNWLWL